MEALTRLTELQQWLEAEAPPALPWAAAPALAPLLAHYAPIRLDQMEAVALLDRTDTKYLLSEAQLAAALAALTGDYWVLDIDGARLSPYHSIYFDTPVFTLYHQHHAGRPRRWKVRGRRYDLTGRAFFEVKAKTGAGRTHKHRLETLGLPQRCTPELAGFVRAETALALDPLAPTLANAFTRLTLVGRETSERVTLDLDLRFAAGARTVALPGLVVAEVKQPRRDRASPFMRHLRDARVRPARFSKYCIGAALLYPALKHNHFKPVLRQVAGVIGDYPHVH